MESEGLAPAPVVAGSPACPAGRALGGARAFRGTRTTLPENADEAEGGDSCRPGFARTLHRFLAVALPTGVVGLMAWFALAVTPENEDGEPVLVVFAVATYACWAGVVTAVGTGVHLRPSRRRRY